MNLLVSFILSRVTVYIIMVVQEAYNDDSLYTMKTFVIQDNI